MSMYNKISVTGSSWLDVNTLSGVTVGTAFSIQNVGAAIVYLYESSTPPVEVDGVILFDALTSGPNSTAYISSGSQKIWVKVADPFKQTFLRIYS